MIIIEHLSQNQTNLTFPSGVDLEERSSLRCREQTSCVLSRGGRPRALSGAGSAGCVRMTGSERLYRRPPASMSRRPARRDNRTTTGELRLRLAAAAVPLSLLSLPSRMKRDSLDGVMRYCPNRPLPVIALFLLLHGHSNDSLHKQSVRLTAGAAEHVVLVDLREGALERQIGQVEVGVDVERLLDFPPLRNHLDPHQAAAVVHRDQVAAVRRRVRGAGDVAVLSDHAVGHAVHDELRPCGAGGVGPAVDEVVAAERGTSCVFLASPSHPPSFSLSQVKPDCDNGNKAHSGMRVSWIAPDAPDVVDDEAGGRDEEVVHPVEASADRLRVNRVVGDSSAGLADHLGNANKEGVSLRTDADDAKKSELDALASLVCRFTRIKFSKLRINMQSVTSDVRGLTCSVGRFLSMSPQLSSHTWS
ncbi:hypothetical protein EYF80_028065 [Liparis tanakae]|uniref:Uncharacterized protein n=1 Tax=Liparis tanakae TaxID=230148 RepID=A0A4Z2H9I1_9TELE|nr:hypothetical protein EYF80_028065 [Liparis tanakae]